MAILTERKSWRREPITPARIQLKLTNAERDNVRNALNYYCGRMPTVAACLAELGVTRDMLLKARSRRRPTYAMAWALAQTIGVPVEKLMNGEWPGDRCPHCGGTGKRSQIVRGAK